MFSVDDFVSKYQEYTDEELVEIRGNIGSYSMEAQEALNIVISNKGGQEKLLQRLEEKMKIVNEIQRIENETQKLAAGGTDVSFLKKMIYSDYLTTEKVHEIIDNKIAENRLHEEDKEIKPRTIIGSIVGGGIASFIGGVLWGMQMMYPKRIFAILFIGLVLLCYGIISISTKQSKKNNVVVVATVISTLAALLIGQLLYRIFGYKG